MRHENYLNAIGLSAGLSTALSASPLIEPLALLLGKRQNRSSGTPTQLLNALNEIASPATTHARGWPKAPNSLSKQLGELGPPLRHKGIEIEFATTHGKGRIITLSCSIDSKRVDDSAL